MYKYLISSDKGGCKMACWAQTLHAAKMECTREFGAGYNDDILRVFYRYADGQVQEAAQRKNSEALWSHIE